MIKAVPKGFTTRPEFRMISLILSVFLILTVFGLNQYRNFGISYDEPAMRMHGIANAKYVLKILNNSKYSELSKDPVFANSKDLFQEDPIGRTHPAIFELLLIATEYFFGLTQNKVKLWEIRHLITFSFTGLGIIFFCIFIYLRFKSLLLALVAALFMIISPRVFGDYFYNNKDSIFLTAYLIATLSIIATLMKPSRFLIALSAVIVGFAVSIRAPAIFIELVFGLTLIISRRAKNEFFESTKIVSFHLVLMFASLVFFQPYFWGDPLTRISEYLLRSNSFDHDGCTITLGSCLQNMNLPWYYIPIWIGVTIPIIFLFLTILGLVLTVKSISLSRAENISSKSNSSLVDLIMLSLVFLPLLIAIFLNTNLYNGWRHFYFLHPFLVYFAIFSLHTILKQKRLSVKIVSASLVTFHILSTGSWMIDNSPLYGLYFNQFAGKDVHDKWEVDYWNLSNREVLTWIVNNDSRPYLKIQTTKDFPIYENSVFLDQNDRVRLHFLWFSRGVDDADYVVAYPDSQRFNTAFLDSSFPNQKFSLVYTRFVGSAKVFEIFKKETD